MRAGNSTRFRSELSCMISHNVGLFSARKIYGYLDLAFIVRCCAQLAKSNLGEANKYLFLKEKRKNIDI